MRLYEEINDKIIVTEYLPDKEKVLEFKKREIEKVPKEERLLSAERNTNWHYIKFGQDNIGLTELLYREKNLAWGYAYHKLECSKLNKKEQEKIINDYIEHVIDINYIPYSIICQSFLAKSKAVFATSCEHSLTVSLCNIILYRETASNKMK